MPFPSCITSPLQLTNYLDFYIKRRRFIWGYTEKELRCKMVHLSSTFCNSHSLQRNEWLLQKSHSRHPEWVGFLLGYIQRKLYFIVRNYYAVDNASEVLFNFQTFALYHCFSNSRLNHHCPRFVKANVLRRSSIRKSCYQCSEWMNAPLRTVVAFCADW